jgi:hypothetical protein
MIIDRLITEVAQYIRDQKNQERAAQASQAQLQFMAPFWAEGLQVERTRNVIELIATAGGIVALGARLYDLAASCGCRKPAPPGQMLCGHRRLGPANGAWRAGMVRAGVP